MIILIRERQCKRKIAQWKLEKYVKDDDMKVVLRKQLKRNLEGRRVRYLSMGHLSRPKRCDASSTGRGSAMRISWLVILVRIAVLRL